MFFHQIIKKIYYFRFFLNQMPPSIIDIHTQLHQRDNEYGFQKLCTPGPHKAVEPENFSLFYIFYIV